MSKEREGNEIYHITTKKVTELVSSLTGESPVNISQIKEKGLVNQIYNAQTRKWGQIIIRTREEAKAHVEYEKEKWCLEQAAKRGVPVASVIALGDSPFNYTIQTSLPGTPADEYGFEGNFLDVWRQIGEYAREINRIPTIGFGKYFQWSPNSGKKFTGWGNYIEKKIEDRIDTYALLANKIIDEQTLTKVLERFEELKRWKVTTTTLAHGDLAFKNTLVDRDGKVTGIIDWDRAASAPNPIYEFAYGFFWMQGGEIDAFIEGYGLSKNGYQKIQREIYTLILLRGLRTALWYTGTNEPDKVERVKKKLEPVLVSL